MGYDKISPQCPVWPYRWSREGSHTYYWRCYSIATEEDDRKKGENTLLKHSVSVATLPGPSIGSNRTSFWNLCRTKQRKLRTQEAITNVWLSCHMWKDWARHLQEFWNLTASPQLTVLTERYGTLWFIQRTRSMMKRRPNWSIVSLARTAPALMLKRQAGSSVWGSRNTRKKSTLSQLVHRPEPPGQERAV